MSTYAVTATESYSVADIENVFRRFTTDLRMIAESSGGMARDKAEQYGYDIEYLAKHDYLLCVDVTLLSGSREVKAVRYTVNTAAGELTPSRPGGVLWSAVPSPYLRVIIQYTQKWYDLSEASQSTVKNRLKLPWGSTDADISHSTLSIASTRSYVSSTYGIHREDYSK